VQLRYCFFVLIGLSSAAFAQDCGTQGATYPIKEKSALALIQERLSQMQVKGEIETHQRKLKAQALNTIERPKAVAGLSKTKQARTFEKDISVSMPEDIKDHSGKIIHKAGTRVNPLNNKLLATKKVLIFLDEDDKEQVEWALKEHQRRRGLAKLVLVSGKPLELMRTFDKPFYFDQTGRLTKYFGFQQIPAMVYQNGDKLMVAEVKP
jgi:conjugal transfer pilus assembly protein TraW